MRTIGKGIQYETTYQTANTKPKPFGVQELRPISGCVVVKTEQERAEGKARNRTLHSGSRDGNRAPLTASLMRTPLCGLRGQFLPSKSPSGDARADQREPISVSHFLPVVITESLFVKIPEQVKRFNRNVGPIDTAL